MCAEERVCVACGCPFVVTATHRARLASLAQRHWWQNPDPIPTRCYACRLANRGETPPAAVMPGPDIERECIQCGDVWLFTTADQHWFARRGFAAPSRCRTCRKANREASRT